LISILTNHLLTFIQSLPQFAQCLGCLNRIETYLCQVDRKPQADDETSEKNASHLHQVVSPKASDPSVVPGESQFNNGVLLSMENVDIAWSLDCSDSILREVNLTINKGITVIVGPSSSGKSTLIGSIMGDNATLKGVIKPPRCAVGYCAETPWILNDTVRHNIIGMNGQFDRSWYTTCLSMAALTRDVEAWPAGDLYLAGSNGISLSGGQRKRVVSPSW
jgi:ABC-type bacteriocin/lantibiotic exporter with double-glycine peptidase domain